jgi:hypothetical protein
MAEDQKKMHESQLWGITNLLRVKISAFRTFAEPLYKIPIQCIAQEPKNVLEMNRIIELFQEKGINY